MARYSLLLSTSNNVVDCMAMHRYCFLQIIMVWIFNNAGKSVFAIVIFHTMINISPYLIPKYGANYNLFIFDS